MSTTIQRTLETLTAEMDGTLMVLSIEKGQYYGINGVGPRIWELLAQPTTAEAVVKQLTAEYEVSPQDCAAQVAGFIDGLRHRGLLVEQS